MTHSNSIPQIWDDPGNVELLERLWLEGKSAAEIAGMIRGASRNAVIGKVHRMKLPRHGANYVVRARKPDQHGNKGRPKASGIVHRVRGRKRAGANGLAFKINQARKDGLGLAEGMEAVLGRKLDPYPLEDEGVDASHLIAFKSRRIGHECAWIPGDPLDGAMCCGKPVKEGSQWCPEHHARVYAGKTALY